ncbi:hypothetical protein CYMTET_33381 [Cymbomonas tetramitiformis]|uniref:Carboxypeptidase n=1 Tax=Cymbomonas tetramitiformis TaxID=36881 RepID=A0AAE0FD84_9CHLO|nr:hypothetical protein CYMTET_33381 [Cymbomonas tetramitiformis]
MTSASELFTYLATILFLHARPSFSLIPQHAVHNLPGGPSPLPHGPHYAGHLPFADGLYSSFYYLAPHPDPAKPLLVWMNGGPGASSLMGLFTELGPLLINGQSRPRPNTTDTDWRLFQNPSAWSEEASLLVWEQPAGVGFSRCNDNSTSSKCRGVPERPWDCYSSADANLEFLQAFFQRYPEEAQRDLYISGESYGGVYVPLLASRYMAARARPTPPSKVALPQLKGVAIGNGCIGFGVAGGCGMDTLEVLVAHLEAAVPDVSREVLRDVRASCGPDLARGLGPEGPFQNVTCRPALRDLFHELGEYNVYNFDNTDTCGPEYQGNWGAGDTFACGGSALADYLDQGDVQVALHVITGGQEPVAWSKRQWDGRWSGYNITAADVRPEMSAAVQANATMLIYNGLEDAAVPHQGAQGWVEGLFGHSITDHRRKWGSPPYGALAGHVTTYVDGRVTYVTVRGAGHLVPADRPLPGRAMISAFLKGVPMPLYAGLPCQKVWTGRDYQSYCNGAGGEHSSNIDNAGSIDIPVVE